MSNEASSSANQLVAKIARSRLGLMALILLVAAGFRMIGLDNTSPPGLEHDEVAHWLINQDILAGKHAIYFTEAYGHEALYHYLQAGFGALVGDHALALRLPSAYFGVLLVAVSYALGRRLFGWQAGLFSAAFMAVVFWPVFFSRLALRAISLPVFSGLSAYFWWRAMPSTANRDPHRRTWVYFAVAGALAGLSLHTYMAARAVPIFYALFSLYLLLFHRRLIREQWRGVLVFWLCLALLALPLAWFLWTNPGSEVRITEIDAPLRTLRQGIFRPVLENGWRIAGMFGFQGDPLWRQNIANQPVFDPVLAALFYGGVAISLWRWRDRRLAFLLLWLATAVIPSLVTIDAPSSIRIINLLPVLMLFPAVVIHTGAQLSTVRDKFSTNLVTALILTGLLLLFGYHSWATAIGLRSIWPENEEVQFVWQAALTHAAAYLDDSTALSAAAIGGWTPETMDPPTMELTLRREDLALRYFNPLDSFILPGGSSGAATTVLHPAILPLATMLEPVAGRRSILPANKAPGEQYALYESAALPPTHPQIRMAVDYGDQLRLLGYDLSDTCAPAETCTLATYWEVLSPADGPRRIFLHRVDEMGNVVDQDDRLGAPAAYWRPGDVVVQLLTLPPGDGPLRLGVYNPVDGRRLATANGEFVEIRISDNRTQDPE